MNCSTSPGIGEGNAEHFGVRILELIADRSIALFAHLHHRDNTCVV